MKKKKDPYAKEIALVESLLLNNWNVVQPQRNINIRQVSIHTWDWPGAGLRVMEVSFMEKPRDGKLAGTSGFSYMQCDRACVGVLFAVERLILHLKHFKKEEDYEQDLKDHKTRLFWEINK